MGFPFIGGLCGDHSPHRTTITQTKRCPIFQFGSWWAHPQQKEFENDATAIPSDRLQQGKFEWRGLVFQYLGSHPAPGRPLGHVTAWTGVPTGSQSTVLFAYAFRHSGILVTEENCTMSEVVTQSSLAWWPRSRYRQQHNQFATEAGHSGTGATFSRAAPQRPLGGVSGALRPPQSPQDLEETSLTSLWQPHRKVKQRG